MKETQRNEAQREEINKLNGQIQNNVLIIEEGMEDAAKLIQKKYRKKLENKNNEEEIKSQKNKEKGRNILFLCIFLRSN